ncbi:MAG: MTAP family purine nucleoside phosphorylase [Candidatus Altiarchaeota archaeon]
MIGIIGGTVLSKTQFIEGGVGREVDTPYGKATVVEGDDITFIQRHGSGNIPPHMINHRANIWALSKLAESVIGVGSSGSLKLSIKPPAIVVPDDYIDSNPQTFYDNEIRHVTPGFDEGLRRQILSTARKSKIKVIDKGIYVQTRGPRLETKAEVRMLTKYADIVGMTIASEATLASELGLKYAAICSVDNYANGLTKKKLDFHEVKSAAMKQQASIEQIIGGL